MATATCQLSEDQFLCSICLDVFTDPVTLPCGHNFCKKCIDEHWNYDAKYKCPYCKQMYNVRPDVRVNVFISEMAAQFKQSQITEQNAAQSEEILCDFCTDPKEKALKSCLVCQASYCDSHLEPHLHMAILKRHKLVKPQRIMESQVEEKKPHRADAEIQDMIEMRQHKIQQLSQMMELNNKDANLEIAKSVQAFTAMKDCVEQDLDVLIKKITTKKKTTEERVKCYIRDLECEISELKNGTKNTKDLSRFSVHRPTYEGIMGRAMAQLDEKLTQQMNVAYFEELQRVQKEKVYVQLDPEKVHPKSTNQGNTKGTSDKPECKCVLAGQSFCSGKFYFEVDVKSRSKWTVGLAKELHVNREVALSPRNAYWIICMRNKNEWYAGAEPSVRLSLKSKPEKVGVFVDYEEGLVSFYDANNAVQIYTFTECDFTQKVHPFFSPCANNGVQLHTSPESACVLQ